MTPPSTCAECAFDALAVAGALMVHAQGASASLRMQMLVSVRLGGFAGAAPRHNILNALDDRIRQVPGGPAWRRRVLAQVMTPLVGNPAASRILDSARLAGTAAGPLNAGGRAVLREIAAALALRD